MIWNTNHMKLWEKQIVFIKYYPFSSAAFTSAQWNISVSAKSLFSTIKTSSHLILHLVK